jgi:hypothetical protein
LSPTEKAYLINSEQFSKKKQRYLRYRIKQKLLQQRPRRDAIEMVNGSRDAAAIATTTAAGVGSNLVGRGIASDDIKYNNERRRGEWESRAAFRQQHFEPTRPFGHGISNPTPCCPSLGLRVQARRPPQLFSLALEV